MNFGLPELIIILVIVLLLFGSTRLPKLSRSIGQSIRELREGFGSKEPAPEDKKKSPEDKKMSSENEKTPSGDEKTFYQDKKAEDKKDENKT